MRRRKGAVWAVIICAIFITAGLILSCDDNGSGGKSKCQRICEKWNECGWVGPSADPPGEEDFGETVAECVDGCEKDTADLTPEELEEAAQCVENTICDDIYVDCMRGGGVATCTDVCEKLIDECEIDMGETVGECTDGCEEDPPPQSILDCIVETSCANIEADACYLGCADACGGLEECELLDDYGYADWDACYNACKTWPDAGTLIDCLLENDCADMIGECGLPE